MFEFKDPEALPTVDDAAVIDAVEGWARDEAAAQRLAAIGELVARRCPTGADPDLVDPRSRWACDPWDATAAEVAAAPGDRQRQPDLFDQLRIGNGAVMVP